MAEDDEPGERRVHYIHHLSYSGRERLVGVFILGAIALLLGLIVAAQGAGRLFQEEFPVYALFANAGGISTGTTVRAKGVEVGRVDSIELTDSNEFRVELKIRKRFHNLVRADSVAELSQLSVIGDAVIKISGGSADEPKVEEGARLAVKEPLSMDEIMARAEPAVQNANETIARVNAIVQRIEPDQVTGMVDDLSATAEELRIAAQRINAGKGTAGRLLQDEELAADLARTAKSVNALVEDTRGQMAAMKPLLAESEKLVTGMNEMLTETRYLMDRVPPLMRRVNRVLRSTDDTLEGVQNTWPISSSVPDEPGRQQVPLLPPDE